MTELLRPQPVTVGSETVAIDGNARYRQVAEWLSQGRQVCLTDTYGTALTLYTWLKRDLRRRRPISDYRTARLYRELLYRLTRTLLIPIHGHRIQLRNAPEIPWLALLYPELERFHLPLPEVLGLNGSWQWYSQGICYEVLEHRLHPFHGVHCTPRGEHLALFDTYLHQCRTLPASAVDVGTGAGPLTFLLLKHGVPHVEATDILANAIRSIHDDLQRVHLRDRVTLSQTDLLPEGPPTDLIVFNPPWIPGERHVGVDAGSYYTDDLFPRFFRAAARRLSAAGRVVLLFSNFAELAGLTTIHPIAREVTEGRRFRVVHRAEAQVRPPGRRSARWQRDLRTDERVQLWELARR